MANNPAVRKRVLRVLNFALFAACWIGVPVSARAANKCVWINEATASGLLGGEAVGEVSEAAAGQPIVCTFTQVTGGVQHTLRVTVEIAADAHARLTAMAQTCGAGVTPLKAIGNEALVCAADERLPGIGERVLGRVRDQVFTITLESSLKNDPLLTRDILKSRIYIAAEQVAGNLF
jgi:hypothetical protein